MTTITKIDITEYLLDRVSITKAEAKALVEDFFGGNSFIVRIWW